jgi:hypothetical protein
MCISHALKHTPDSGRFVELEMLKTSVFRFPDDKNRDTARVLSAARKDKISTKLPMIIRHMGMDKKIITRHVICNIWWASF